MTRIYTIGHSRHPLAVLIDLLRQQGIQTLADIRSIPASRRMPWFSRAPLAAALTEVGIRYVWMGDRLGGKPRDAAVHGSDGEVDYAAVRATSRFQTGMELLEKTAAASSTAIMCAEEDPMHCHRWLLLGPAMAERHMEVLHIRGDGRVESMAPVQNWLF
ncbi:DUF488 domain-containing protein [Terriglobus albidus]|uniref:DUF488 domain-containing protein n=1 Tax=Terriglobus albidus TaxID=1592106 RepID=UPI00164ECB9B|nr:DUF488 domain-containing protein [Terriglobus albidus]